MSCPVLTVYGSVSVFQEYNFSFQSIVKSNCNPLLRWMESAEVAHSLIVPRVKSSAGQEVRFVNNLVGSIQVLRASLLLFHITVAEC
jgi:hypothetical protein